MKDPLAMLEEADEEEDKQQEETEIIDKVSDGQSDVVDSQKSINVVEYI